MAKVQFGNDTGEEPQKRSKFAAVTANYFSHVKGNKNKATMTAIPLTFIQIFTEHFSKEGEPAATITNTAGNKFSVPLFQRRYCWEHDQIRVLWQDIKEMFLSNNQFPHSLGRVLLVREKQEDIINDDIDATKNIEHYLCVDGQQRITTVIVLLLALLTVNQSAHLDTICDILFYNVQSLPEVAGLELNEKTLGSFCRWVPTHFDRTTFITSLQGKDVITQNAPIEFAINFFKAKLAKLIEKQMKLNQQHKQHVITAFVETICKLEFVVLLLHSSCNPQQAFESFARKSNFAQDFYKLITLREGKRLSSVDLVRNFILSKICKENQLHFFENNWSAFEWEIFRCDPTECGSNGSKADQLLNKWLNHFLQAHWYEEKMTEEFNVVDKIDLVVNYPKFVVACNNRIQQLLDSPQVTWDSFSQYSRYELAVCEAVKEMKAFKLPESTQDS